MASMGGIEKRCRASEPTDQVSRWCLSCKDRKAPSMTCPRSSPRSRQSGPEERASRNATLFSRFHPRTRLDVNTGLVGHAYGTVHVTKPWSEMVGGSTHKFSMLQSERVMTTSSRPPAEWVGESTCWTKANDSRMPFNVMQSPPSRSSKWMGAHFWNPGGGPKFEITPLCPQKKSGTVDFS